MAAIRLSGQRGLSNELMSAGDCMLVPEIFSTNSTVGNATLLAASLITGELYRTGPTGAYTDTFDTAANILLAVAGNLPSPAVVPGLSFKLRLINTVAFAETIALGAGMVSGLGGANILLNPASGFRDYLMTFLSVQPIVSNAANLTNGSAVFTWSLNPGQVSEFEGPSPLAVNVMPGCSVTGTGIAAGTTLLGITQGVGGTLGGTLSANATATGVSGLTFGPTISVNTSGSGSL